MTQIQPGKKFGCREIPCAFCKLSNLGRGKYPQCQAAFFAVHGEDFPAQLQLLPALDGKYSKAPAPKIVLITLSLTKIHLYSVFRRRIGIIGDIMDVPLSMRCDFQGFQVNQKHISYIVHLMYQITSMRKREKKGFTILL